MGSQTMSQGLEIEIKQWQRNLEIAEKNLSNARTEGEKSAARSNVLRAKQMLKSKKEALKRAKEREKKEAAKKAAKKR